MKTILIHLDDEQHEELMNVKGERSWRDLLLIHIEPKKRVVKNETHNN